MKFTRSLPLWVLLMIPGAFWAQTFTSNGAVIQVTSGGILHCNGGLSLQGSSTLDNDGYMDITLNSTAILPGTFSILGASAVSGSGQYRVEQDWINNASFTANSSVVELYGSTQQLITSTNGTVTEFNILTLTGNGTGVDRRKTLESVDARISTSGALNLNNRELYTQGNEMTVLNTATNAITNDITYGAEGFVSSDFTGDLAWATNQFQPYIFPVGSSNGTLRYRPAIIEPLSSASGLFKVHLNNEIGDNYGYFLAQHDIDISAANQNYFHSINRSSGTMSANVSLAYDPSVDGDWSGIAQWRNVNTMWNSLGDETVSGVSNYSYVTKADWDFFDSSTPYILTLPENQLIIPNVFTPNGDGDNDLYFVTAKNITDYSIVIVNRWGETMFESNDIAEPWDGTTNGVRCNDGTYFYLLRGQSAAGEIVKQGHITVASGK